MGAGLQNRPPSAICNQVGEKMSITLNGKDVNLQSGVDTVDKLLSHYHLENRIVIIEVNKEIILKENYKTTNLSDGDVVEIIHFVGGG